MALDPKALEQMEHIAQRAAKAAVRETFTALGVDLSKPTEVQRDFAHLREWRTTVQGVRRKSIYAAVMVLVSGGLAALWIGIKALATGVVH